MPLELLMLEHYCAWLIAGPEGAALWFALRLATGEGRPSSDGWPVLLRGVDGYGWTVDLFEIPALALQVYFAGLPVACCIVFGFTLLAVVIDVVIELVSGI